MNKLIENKSFIATLFLILTLINQTAFAVATVPSVTVIEDFVPGAERGQFTVTNNSSQAVYAFAVGNNNANQTLGWSGENSVLEQLIPSSELNNLWSSNVITRSSWEANNRDFGLGKYANGAWAVPDTSTLDWDTLFGSQFNQVVAYWVIGSNAPLLVNTPGSVSNPILSGDTQSHFFFFSDQAFSPFVAFGQSGTIIAGGQTGNTTVIPIPASFWLLGSALIAFFRFQRRQ